MLPLTVGQEGVRALLGCALWWGEWKFMRASVWVSVCGSITCNQQLRSIQPPIACLGRHKMNACMYLSAAKGHATCGSCCLVYRFYLIPARFTARAHKSWVPQLSMLARIADVHIICCKCAGDLIATIRTGTFFANIQGVRLATINICANVNQRHAHNMCQISQRKNSWHLNVPCPFLSRVKPRCTCKPSHRNARVSH